MKYEVLVDIFQGNLLRDTEVNSFIQSVYTEILNEFPLGEIVIGQLFVFERIYDKLKNYPQLSDISFKVKSIEGSIIELEPPEIIHYLNGILN
jgi:hypothetical protein